MESAVNITCAACGMPHLRPLAKITGYIEGLGYSVRECQKCRSQSATPCHVPFGLYDAIYRNANVIEGGYDRYLRYAAEILEAADPLGWLANQEDMYWGIRQLLETTGLPKHAKIVEAGSGLGYFTYALRAVGYDAVGVDLSPVAVEAAKHRFGDHYRAANVIEDPDVGQASTVIASELIEHLPDPLSFLVALGSSLSNTGSIIISTPNRDTYPDESVWNTDLPPVHLHWFTEAGIQELAKRAGFRAEFADFTARNATGNHRRWTAGSQYRAPRFDQSLHPMAAPGPAQAVKRWTFNRIVRGLLGRMHLRRTKGVTGIDRLHGRRSVALVARLVRDGA